MPSGNLNKQALENDHRFEKRKTSLAEYWHTIMALFWKNITRLRRNIPVLLFQFALPAIQVILFCICIGADPFNIPLAVVNEDNQVLSRQFLDNLDPYTVTQYRFASVNEGKDAVRNGSMWGVLHIPENFTLALIKRMTLGEDVDDAVIEESTIKVYPDLTNQQISYTMERSFKDAFQIFAKKALETYGRNPQLAEFPLAMGEPVYGELKHQGELDWVLANKRILFEISTLSFLTCFFSFDRLSRVHGQWRYRVDHLHHGHRFDSIGIYSGAKRRSIRAFAGGRRGHTAGTGRSRTHPDHCDGRSDLLCARLHVPGLRNTESRSVHLGRTFAVASGLYWYGFR